ncbi:MAG: ATP-grasp domain-containing protein [Elusimicrobia bacterium]|nr:ATP-grasp domain-containing protein [Elusimicrobiota bacterium]MBD3412641.1 ATP-grasp domain-containing protein [Elusimicrobiota bacterium]
MMRSVYLTDTSWRTAYYACKALARRGLTVIGLTSVPSIYNRSIYYSDFKTVPSPESDPDAWISAVEKSITPGSVLLPISPVSISVVSANADRLSKKLLIPCLPQDQLASAFDKLKTISIASQIGIPVPSTIKISDQNDCIEQCRNLSYPIVLKINIENNWDPKQRYGIAYNQSEVAVIYEKLSKLKTGVIAQEYIIGQGVGISVLAHKGRIIASYTHQRLREQYITGGPSTFCASYHSEQLEEYAQRFLKQSGWSGIFMLEFKLNKERNTYYLMEINPRFWGSMELAIRSGINFPYLYYQWICGEPIDTVNNKTKHIKLKYLKMDTKAFATYVHDPHTTSRFLKILRYFGEYSDFRVRYNLDCKDWKINIPEIIETIKNIGKILYYAF